MTLSASSDVNRIDLFLYLLFNDIIMLPAHERFRNRVAIPLTVVGCLALAAEAMASDTFTQDEGCATAEVNGRGDVIDAVTHGAEGLGLPVGTDSNLGNSLMAAANTANSNAPGGMVSAGDQIKVCATQQPLNIVAPWHIRASVVA
jgi:hypothetical protein